MRRLLPLAVAALLLAACGQRGDLYLPKEPSATVVVPVTPAPAPASTDEESDGRPRQSPIPPPAN